MIQPKEHNNFPVTDLKEMEIRDLPNKKYKIKKYKIVILRKLSELQDNTER